MHNNDILYKITIYKTDVTSNKDLVRQQFGQSIIVSFSARVRDNKSFLGPTAAIVFDEIVVNNGDAYDPYTGVFTAPVDGVYHFASTVLSGFNSTIETMLMVNGEEVGRMFSGAFLSRGSGTNNVLVNLKEADEVSVNVFYGNGDYVHGLWSTFMGYLINALY
ncbi:cerebellin-3 [Patella vulgata]|uniref:cerebellin-3 n=1 Tax=Patella vulgata TaxID=6465 RepID=UPI0024A8DBC9|nr:cerebellin-3 [Patella vulgata]